MKPKTCRVCNSGYLKRFLSLGDIPPVNAFLPPAALDKEKAYPLNVSYCESCLLVQLEDVVPPDRLFSTYLHLSSASASNVEHLREFSDLLKDRFNIHDGTSILEFGSNDGTLLSFLKKYTPLVLGVDPAQNLSLLSGEKGVETLVSFFNAAVAEDILRKKGRFDLLIGLNVIPHTPDVVDLLRGARTLLKPDGTLVMEGVYVIETILRGEFDTIYHEHFYSFSLHSLISTFSQADLTVADVEIIPTQGGSLRVYAQRKESGVSPSKRVSELLRVEKEKGYTSPSVYDRVEEMARDFRANLRRLIQEEKKKGKLIGLGAPARGVVILNYCGLGADDFQFLIDDTPLKQGMLTPGAHVPVQSWDALANAGDESYMLLSWNYKEHLLKKLRKEKPSARVIQPFPSLEVLTLG